MRKVDLPDGPFSGRLLWHNPLTGAWIRLITALRIICGIPSHWLTWLVRGTIERRRRLYGGDRGWYAAANNSHISDKEVSSAFREYLLMVLNPTSDWAGAAYSGLAGILIFGHPHIMRIYLERGFEEVEPIGLNYVNLSVIRGRMGDFGECLSAAESGLLFLSADPAYACRNYFPGYQQKEIDFCLSRLQELRDVARRSIKTEEFRGDGLK